MNNRDKTKEQLIAELTELRQRISELDKDEDERTKIEDKLFKSKHDWENTFNTITDMITIHDKDFNIIQSNKAAEKLLKLPDLEKAINTKCFNYYHGTDKPPEGCPSCDCLNTGESCNFEIFEPHLNSYVEIRVIPRFNINNEIDGLIHVVRDISERKQMEEKLQTLSITDELTGLYNRRGFFTFANKELNISNRMEKGVLLLYADLDYLKAINDGFGHENGDLLLVRTANLLKDIFRESDIIARIGGDEFVIFSLGNTHKDVETLQVRLEKGIENYNKKRDHIFKMSLSIGIVYCKQECSYSIDELLAQADELMYENKRNKEKAKLK
jgi:diguanylate cyclase (GGDEF)-like protein